MERRGDSPRPAPRPPLALSWNAAGQPAEAGGGLTEWGCREGHVGEGVGIREGVGRGRGWHAWGGHPFFVASSCPVIGPPSFLPSFHFDGATLTALGCGQRNGAVEWVLFLVFVSARGIS